MGGSSALFLLRVVVERMLHGSSGLGITCRLKASKLLSDLENRVPRVRLSFNVMFWLEHVKHVKMCESTASSQDRLLTSSSDLFDAKKVVNANQEPDPLITQQSRSIRLLFLLRPVCAQTQTHTLNLQLSRNEISDSLAVSFHSSRHCSSVKVVWRLRELVVSTQRRTACGFVNDFTLRQKQATPHRTPGFRFWPTQKPGTVFSVEIHEV